METVETTPRSRPDDLAQRVTELETHLEAVADPIARELADELVATVLDLYGEGLERIFGALAEGGQEALAVRDALVEDGVVSSLLLIHDLHPVPLEARVEQALESVRPYLRSHSGDVELVALEDGVAQLRLRGTCKGCPSSAMTLELAITTALDEAAPDLAGVEVEGLTAQRSFAAGTLPLVGGGGTASDAGWTTLGGIDGLEPDTLRETTVDGERLVVANVAGTLLAYKDACAGCGSPLGAGHLEVGILACPACERSYQLPLAGRAVGGAEDLHLTPVPLVLEAGGAKVAVAG